MQNEHEPLYFLSHSHARVTTKLSDSSEFGLEYLKAIAAGLPIASTDNSAALELFGSQAVLYCAVGDPESISNQILSAFMNYETLLDSALLENKLILNNYSLERMTLRTINLLKPFITIMVERPIPCKSFGLDLESKTY